MNVESVIPILHVSDIAQSVVWFRKLGWSPGFQWRADPEAGGPIDFASVFRIGTAIGEH